MEIHIPEPGDVLAVLISIVDLNDDILWGGIFQNKGNLLLKTDRIFRKVKLYPRIVDRENTFPVIAVIKVLDHFLKMGFVRIHGAKCGVCGQRVIDVVRRACGGMDPHAVHIKIIYLIMEVNIRCGKIRLRSLEPTVRAMINAKLSVMEKVVFQFFSTGTAENTFPDLRTGNIVKNLFADPIGHEWILAFFCKCVRKNVVTVDDQFCVRNTCDGCFQFVVGNIDFAETVQLIPGNIGQKRVVRLELRKHADGSDLVHFDTGIVRIQLTMPVC